MENSQEQCACDAVLVLSLLNSGVNLIFLQVSSSLIIRLSLLRLPELSVSILLCLGLKVLEIINSEQFAFAGISGFEF